MNTPRSLGSIRWSVPLSQELIGQLTKVAEFKSVDSLSDADCTGLINRGITYIDSGTLAICIHTPAMKAANHILLGAGAWFGNYDNQTKFPMSSLTITQIEPVSLVHFENRRLDKIALDNVEAFKWFYALTFESKAKWLQAQLIGSENINVRLVYFLLECANLYGGDSVQPQLTISQQSVSEITGIARQRVNEILKELEWEKLVQLERGAIRLLNRSGLERKLAGVDLSMWDPRGGTHSHLR